MPTAALRSAPVTAEDLQGKVRQTHAAKLAAVRYERDRTLFRSCADKQGNLVAGSDSNGLVMRFGPDGKPFGLLDSPLREIHDIAVGADGSVYVLALGESVSKPPEAAAAATPSPESKTVSVDKPSPLRRHPQRAATI